eukprot:NODE_216_length_14242_cov_0.417592.p4 type:complete len:329 gc:universal NODE_216_length_14242_cov_0.417592:10135-9149(-)
MILSPTIFQAESEIYTIINDRLNCNNKSEILELDSSSGCYNNNKFYIGTFIGKILILSSSKRVEKAIDAHNGSIVNILPFNDCVISSGEDGMIKLWSSTGILRATVAKSYLPIVQIALIGNEVLYSCCDKLHACDVYSNVKRTFNTNFIISCIHVCNKLVFVGGMNGKLKIYKEFKLKSEVQLESKIFSIYANEHLNLIYCGMQSRLRILDYNLSSLKYYNVPGIVYAIHSLDNGCIYYISSENQEKLFYFKDILKYGYHVYFRDGIEIDDIVNKTIHSIDVPIGNILQVIVKHSVFVVLKNKIIIYNQSEFALDVSFDVKHIFVQKK